MDVQTENTDPLPCESQPSGKIRKGFKLFGKRKPGNIFSIRSKGDGNNKSPVKTEKSLDGLSESTAADSEQESDKEKGNEVSQGEREQTDEEPLSEDGVQAAAPARTSISSNSSAKSLSFLSLLRGGRRGMGDRRAQTVSQPRGRQRRGLKGLFGNVKFRSKDKDEKEDAPPSPLLMSSRTNSVEIIKEDLSLTPKSHPRSLDSPETESYDPLQSETTQDSAATSPSQTSANVSKSTEHVSPLPASEPPMVPGDNSLSSLLADISSLLTFDSISGGDILADVEAEWGKASSAISAVVTESTPSSTSLFSKPTISSPLTSTSAVLATTTMKPSPEAVPSTSSTQSATSPTKTTSASSPIAKPSTIITTLTKSSTLTTQSVKVSSDFTPQSASITPITLTTFSALKKSSPLLTTKSSLSTTCTATTAPPYVLPAVAKPSSVSPTLTSTVSKISSEIAAPSQTSSVSKSSSVATSPPDKPPVTHSSPTPSTQHSLAKLDSASCVNLQTSTSYKPFLSSITGESRAPASESLACTVTTKPSPVSSSKSTTVNSSSAPPVLSQPPIFSTSTFTSTTKTQPISSFVPAPSLPPAYKPPPPAVFSDRTHPAPTPTRVPITSDSSIPYQTTPAAVQIPVLQSKGLSAPFQTSVSKDPPFPMQVSQSKAIPSAAQISASMSKDSSTPAQMPIFASKDLSDPVPTPVPGQVSHPKTPAQTSPASVSIDSPTLAQIPVSRSRELPPSACMPISVSKDSPSHLVSLCSQISVSHAQIPVAQTKPPSMPTPAPCPVSSLSSPTPPWQTEAPISVKTRGSEQTSVVWKLSSPSSAEAPGSTFAPNKTEEQNESRSSLQATPRERKIPQAKASGLSKIPVVGGGRAGKTPVWDSQHVDDEAGREPPATGLEEERASFNSQDAGGNDKIIDVEVNVAKQSLEESQQQPQRALTSLPRDSKIPVKHGASQIPQVKETPRTKIPVSKVPVRRVGNKPAATGGGVQIRK